MSVQTLIKFQLIRFYRDMSGAVIIEFFFSIIVLLLLFFFMFDLAFTRGEIGKLDNLSYSMVNLLRERTQLYSVNGHVNENLSPAEMRNGKIFYQDVDNFRMLAKSMFYGDPHDKRPLYIVLGSLQFAKTPLDAKPRLANPTTILQGDTNVCHPTTDLKTLQNIAPRSEVDNQRILPLYQVTVCVPSKSLFKSFLAGKNYTAGLLRSSSVTVGR
ncbi:hypothetical protein A6A19_01800 [Actinobacillus delphinicola]|uniref:tight adherence pilus pseudopilin TadF n=1 Tax=Actinobacillus delphinicola TaxID=51161 RepID=UPI0024426660|nr:tight adherence pilus pseudopilin TadF [Actinobacillus delphinicola]MDG6896761.1 hypothetical protein [Actinobacillus delphinicola]